MYVIVWIQSKERTRKDVFKKKFYSTQTNFLKLVFFEKKKTKIKN